MTKKGPRMQEAYNYAAPWAERDAAGELHEYGPSPTTYARHLAQHKLWTWKPESKLARSLPDRDRMRDWMRMADGSLRQEVPARERDVFIAIYEQGHSVRWTARNLGMSRSSVRVLLKRIRGRLPDPD